MLAYFNQILFPFTTLLYALFAGAGVGPGHYDKVAGGPEGTDQRTSYYSRSLSGEEVRLHVPVSELELGDTLFFSAYVIDQEYDAPSDKSLTLYAYLLDSEGHPATGSAFYLEDGRASGFFPISETGGNGKYNLVAFTARQQQFSPEEVAVHPVVIGTKSGEGNRPVLRFIPEGGNIIAGVPVQVSYYCSEPDHIDWQQAGTLRDSQGRPVAEIIGDGSGSGSFRLSPYQSDFSVVFKSKSGKELTYELPATKHSGAALHLAEMRGDSVARIAVHFSHPHLYPKAHLAAIQNGNMLIREDFTPSRRNLFDISVGSLSGGELHFGLWDQDGNLLSGLNLPLSSMVKRALEVVPAFSSGADNGAIKVSTPEGEGIQGHFTLTVRTEKHPNYTTLKEMGAGDPIAFWKQIKDHDQREGTSLVDYETCRLVLVNKKGKPVPDRQISIVDGDFTTVLRTGKDGSMKLPNYRLMRSLIFHLPEASYSLTVPGEDNDDFIMEVGKKLSGTDHKNCSHASHAESYRNHVSVRQSENNRWTICKYCSTDPPHTSIHKNPAVYWKFDATTDDEGRLTFDLPGEWKGQSLYIQLAGFTEDGHYLDRELYVN